MNFKNSTIKIGATIILTIFIVACASNQNEHSEPQKPSSNKEQTFDEKMQLGQTIYTQYCQICHQASGKGAPGMFPPLAQSDYMLADKARTIRVIANGLSGEIMVNGETYNQTMLKPNPPYTNEQLAAIATYIYNSFGNSAGEVQLSEVTDALNSK